MFFKLTIVNLLVSELYILLKCLNSLKNSPRVCLWFAAKDGEGGEQNHCHLTRKSLPPLAELLLKFSFCL